MIGADSGGNSGDCSACAWPPCTTTIGSTNGVARVPTRGRSISNGRAGCSIASSAAISFTPESPLKNAPAGSPAASHTSATVDTAARAAVVAAGRVANQARSWRIAVRPA